MRRLFRTTPHVPLQCNTSDCGIYVLQDVEVAQTCEYLRFECKLKLNKDKHSMRRPLRPSRQMFPCNQTCLIAEYVIQYDYACLAEGEWLTDTVIDIYARYVDIHILLTFHRFNCRMYRVIFTYPLSPSEGGIDVYPSDYACLAEGGGGANGHSNCLRWTNHQPTSHTLVIQHTNVLFRAVCPQKIKHGHVCSDVYFITSCPTAPLTKTKDMKLWKVWQARWIYPKNQSVISLAEITWFPRILANEYLSFSWGRRFAKTFFSEGRQSVQTDAGCILGISSRYWGCGRYSHLTTRIY
jgi:hypothetical protein